MISTLIINNYDVTKQLTNADQLDSFTFNEIQRNRHVLHLHLPEVGPLVEPSAPLLAQNLQQGDQPQTV